MDMNWDYVAEYMERKGVKVRWEEGYFECPHCGYVVHEQQFPLPVLCPYCGFNE